MTLGLLAVAKKKAQAFADQTAALTGAQGINVHQCFVDYWVQGTGSDALQVMLKAHFSELKKASIVTRKTAVATVMGTSRVGTLSRVVAGEGFSQLAVAVMQKALAITAR